MNWVPVAAWGAAVLIAAVVLGFCAYEISWKARRLRSDLQRLQRTADEITRLQGRLVEVQGRVTTAGQR
ncbi:MAG: hypothetical protein J0H43_08675 [Actinobacteria bacterium]|nr:hypothetical protein [Actinomycetota bacterium]